MDIFFTSDCHFFHNNIISHCNRTFENVDEMNDQLIYNWNSTVSKKDMTYVLGDFSAYVPKNKFFDLEKILKALNGQKVLIIGNHDHKKTLNFKGWSCVKDYHEIKHNKRRYCMSHYPFKSWRGSHKGEKSAIQCFGHCHHTLTTLEPYQIDVGVDGWNFTPISIDNIELFLT